jgi:hypothetical protein
MRRSGTGSGGGYGSNKHVDSRAPKVEPRPKAINPGYVSQLGNKVGNHVTDRKRETGYTGEKMSLGRGYATPVGPTNFMVAGPGGGRKVYGSGSQSTYGQPAPGNAPNKSTDILNEFGPNYKAPRS